MQFLQLGEIFPALIQNQEKSMLILVNHFSESIRWNGSILYKNGFIWVMRRNTFSWFFCCCCCKTVVYLFSIILDCVTCFVCLFKHFLDDNTHKNFITYDRMHNNVILKYINISNTQYCNKQYCSDNFLFRNKHISTGSRIGSTESSARVGS